MTLRKIIIYFRMAVLRKYCLSEKNVMKKQQIMLRNMLNYAVKHCKYYMNYKHKTIEQFPIMTKQEISKKKEEFVSDEIDRINHWNAYTGGSTGEPFHFYQSGGNENGFGLRKWKLYGYEKGDKILAMDGIEIDDRLIKENVFWCQEAVDDIPFGSFGLSSLYLTKENARHYFDFINSFNPSYIRGYPSFIYSIITYAEESGYQFTIKLKAIELTSEMAQPYQIKKIKEFFNTNVYLQYGHTEAIIFAYTYNETYKYRVEPLYGYVEVLDAEGKHVKEGEEGEIIVTSLHNFAMPLIRYSTGDRAIYGGKDNRYIYLNTVLGRTQDYIINQKKEKVLLTALIFGQHCPALGNIIRWQIEQFEPGKIIIKIIKGKKFNEKDENQIYELFETKGNVITKIVYVTDIPLTTRGKSKMIIQHLDLCLFE